MRRALREVQREPRGGDWDEARSVPVPPLSPPLSPPFPFPLEPPRACEREWDPLLGTAEERGGDRTKRSDEAVRVQLASSPASRSCALWVVAQVAPRRAAGKPDLVVRALVERARPRVSAKVRHVDVLLPRGPGPWNACLAGIAAGVVEHFPVVPEATEGGGTTEGGGGGGRVSKRGRRTDGEGRRKKSGGGRPSHAFRRKAVRATRHIARRVARSVWGDASDHAHEHEPAAPELRPL